jgi:hypothetical protein
LRKEVILEGKGGRKEGKGEEGEAGRLEKT